MSMRFEPSKRRSSSDRWTTTLTLEQLEQRAMMAFDVLDQQLQALQDPTHDQPAVSAAFANPRVGSAPTVAQAISIVGGNRISGRHASLSVLGQDNGGESNLRYSWQMVTAPLGAQINFARNHDNSAKVNTLTFNRAGAYTIRVTITDSQGLRTTSDVALEVVPTLTSISVRTASGTTLFSNATTTSSNTSERFTLVGLDQFGTIMRTPPNGQWQVTSQPTGGNATFATNAGWTTFSFQRAGNYGVRVTSGSMSQQFNVNVTPVLRSLSFRSATGSVIESSQAIAVNGSSHRLNVAGVDQFNQPMNSFTGLTWSTSSRPINGNAAVTMSGTQATVSFTAAGTYTLRAQSGTLNASITFQVAQVVTNIRATGTGGAAIGGSGLVVNGSSQALAGIAYDQFGQVMATQPTITWEIASQPTSASAALTPSGNAVTAQFDKAGAYSLRASAAGRSSIIPISVGQTLRSFSLTSADGTLVQSSPVGTSSTSQSFAIQGRDQFGAPMNVNSPIAWSTLSAPSGGVATVTVSSGTATIRFNRAGDYTLRASTGQHSQSISIHVSQVLTGIVALSPTGQALSTSAGTSVISTSTRVTAEARDQFGQRMLTQPTFQWTPGTAPTDGTATISSVGAQATVSFNRAGQYSVQVAGGNRSITIPFNVVSTLSRIAITSDAASVNYLATQKFTITGFNQFQHSMVIPTTTIPAWTATLGTISSTGWFRAGSVAGSAVVTARIGAVTATATVQVTAPTVVTTLQDPAISALVQQFYADGELNRVDVISILRSAGEDGSVNATELSDLRLLVSANGNYRMPAHVRELAKDVVNSNPANLRYQGQAAGNLVAGSSSTLLNNLVDKWFLGTDLPAITGSGISYRTATGTLFATAPRLSDANQGALGDCYFIASVASIAETFPDAIRNLFIDNGDNTYTVRFYAGALGAFYTSDGLISSGFRSGTGVADYVTVNLSLPTYASGMLAYSGSGLSAFSATTPLWIALAEKAYAQWNETGNAGRDGTNRYEAIEGGWMSDVNAQVLGYNSTNYAFSSSTKQAMINALSADRAVTLGTNGNPGAGLVGSHAYVVTGYNAATDRFDLFNPWGDVHPAPLTWAQLQANCTQFVVVDPRGSVAVQTPRVTNAAAWAFTAAPLSALSDLPPSAATSASWTIDAFETGFALSVDVSVEGSRVALPAVHDPHAVGSGTQAEALTYAPQDLHDEPSSNLNAGLSQLALIDEVMAHCGRVLGSV